MAESVRYVVERFNWRPLGEGGWALGMGTFRLASFATEAEAAAECHRREANARRRVNPFRCGNTLAELTPLPEPVFLDWLRDLGLNPPDPVPLNLDGWAAWFDEAEPSDAQRTHVWEGLQRVKFFRVVERPNVPIGYVLMSPTWHYNDEYNSLYEEGGTVKAVYRTREGAIRAAERLVRERGDSSRWKPTGADLFDPETYMEQAMVGGHFDIVEIELEGLQ